MDFQLFDLVLQAGLIVKLVLVLLALMSIFSWAVIWTKWRELRSASKDSEAFIEVYQDGALGDSYEAARSLDRSPLAAVYVESCDEMGRVAKKTGKPLGRLDATQVRGLGKRVDWAISREAQRLERGLSLLATTGSSAPFIGLFGTVVGIIQSFQDIAVAGSASLAVVAPGIAEALIATAVGLLAAIPASIFFNVFVGRIDALRASLELFNVELQADLVAMAERTASGDAPSASSTRTLAG